VTTGYVSEIEVRHTVTDGTLEVLLRVPEGPDSGIAVALSPEDALRLSESLRACADYCLSEA
jgi:hypothetical protein